MPEGHDFEKLPAGTVVDKVPYPPKVKPANDIRSWQFDLGSDAWFVHQKSQGRFKIFANGTNRSLSVFRPPLCGFLDLPQRTRLDPNDESQGQPTR